MTKKNGYNLEKIAHKISYYRKERLDIFRELSVNQKSEVIVYLSKHLQFEIVSKLDQIELIGILENLDTDEATDIVQLLPKSKRNKIVGKLNEQLKSGITLLLQFDPKTAAGLMNINYIQIRDDDNMVSVAEQVKIHEKRTGKLPVVLVMKGGMLKGYLPVYRLIAGSAKSKAGKYVRKIIGIKYTAKLDEVIEVFHRYPHNKIVVLGENKNVLGIIYSDDILGALREKESASLYDFAGVSQEESVLDSAKRKVKYRYKWLIINLGTAFLAAFTVGLFDEVISKYVLLAVYMPIVAGMGGNASTQTLVVLVRGISLKQISFKTVWKTLRNELGAGFVNGLINGLIVTGIVFIKDGDLRIGLILAIAMVMNLLIAAFFGTIVPLLMQKMGKDPAASATIFITTATDVLGFFIFLSLATIILN